MIAKLSRVLDNFPGPANQTRCFLHILNLTAKSIIRQFDVPKSKNGTAMDTVAQALADLAEGLDGDNLEEYEGEDDVDNVDDKPLAEWASMVSRGHKGAAGMRSVLTFEKVVWIVDARVER
jgi:hypothetical protein